MAPVEEIGNKKKKDVGTLTLESRSSQSFFLSSKVITITKKNVSIYKQYNNKRDYLLIEK